MRQSVIKNRKGEIVKYNHSKWLAISGNYGGSPGRWTALSGSANWSNLAFTSDEQMQQLYGYGWTKRLLHRLQQDLGPEDLEASALRTHGGRDRDPGAAGSGR